MLAFNAFLRNADSPCECVFSNTVVLVNICICVVPCIDLCCWGVKVRDLEHFCVVVVFGIDVTMANHKRINMTPEARYPGNARRVMDKFALYTGRPRLPVVESQIRDDDDDDLIRIADIQASLTDNNDDDDDDDLVPINTRAPFDKRQQKRAASAPRVRPRTHLIDVSIDNDNDFSDDDDDDDVPIPNIMAFVRK